VQPDGFTIYVLDRADDGHVTGGFRKRFDEPFKAKKAHGYLKDFRKWLPIGPAETAELRDVLSKTPAKEKVK
jgi:hypothetical protein